MSLKPDYERGSVKLYCGDAREIAPSLGRLDTVVTDPPYGMAFQSAHREVQYEPIEGDANEDLLIWASELPVYHSRYVFCRWGNLGSIKPRSLITWVKNNWSMGDLEHEHARQTEVLAFWPGLHHIWANKRPTDVVFHPRSGNVFHPTEKPVSLMREIVGWTEGIVFDPFSGSGTTAIACIELGRPFIGCEVSRPYFDVACKRIDAAFESFSLIAPTPPAHRQMELHECPTPPERGMETE